MSQDTHGESEEGKFDDEGAEENKKEEMQEFAQRFYLFISSYALSEAEQDYYHPPREIHRKIKDYLVTLTPDQLAAILDQCFHEMGGDLSRKIFNQYLLTAASKAGFVEIVSVLLERQGEDKFDITNPDDAFAMRVSLLNALGESVVGNLLLAYGIQPNHPAVVSMLLRRYRNGDQTTPLMAVVAKGWPPEIVRQFFLPQSPEVLNAQTSRCKETALMWAAENGHLGLVQLLVEAGADKELRDKCDRTALMFAAQAGKSAVVSYLLAHGADSGCKTRHGEIAFSFAVDGGCDVGVICQLLPQNKEEIDARHGSHHPALMHAAERGDVEVVRLLLDAKADVEALQKNSDTPLMRALGRGHSEVALLLLAQGADPTRAGRMGLIRAAGGGCDHRVISKLLAKAGASEVSAALLAAAEKGNAAVIKQLLDAGANIEIRDSQEKTPLMLALQNGHPEVAKVLLSRGANPLAQDKYRNTTLKLAADKGYTSIVDALLSNPSVHDLLNVFSCDPNAEGSALMCAAQWGHLEVVRLLLIAGANTALISRWEKKTALILAMEENHPEVVALLLNREPHICDQRATLELVFETLLSNRGKSIANRQEDALNLFDECAYENLGPDKRTPERRKKDALKILSCLLQEGIVSRRIQPGYPFSAKMHAINGEFLAPFRARVLDHFQAVEKVLHDEPIKMPADLANLARKWVVLSEQEEAAEKAAEAKAKERAEAEATCSASAAASSTSASSTSVWSTSAHAVAEHKAGQEEAALLDDGIDISALLDDGGAPLDEKDSSPQPTISASSSSSVSSSLPGIRFRPPPRPDVSDVTAPSDVEVQLVVQTPKPEVMG